LTSNFDPNEKSLCYAIPGILEETKLHIPPKERKEKDYMRGSLKDTGRFSPMTQLAMRVATRTHISFIVHA
jgi:hypothetical protein